MIDLNKITASINRMTDEQKKYYKATHEKLLTEETLETLKKGKEFVDEAIKISDNNEKEVVVTLLIIYIYFKQSNQKNK